MGEEQEQHGVSAELMRELLQENRALLRLLSCSLQNHEVSGLGHAGDDALAQPGSADELLPVYQELLELLQIVSATFDPRRTECDGGDRSPRDGT